MREIAGRLIVIWLVECVGSLILVIISTGFGMTMPTAFISYAHENDSHRTKAIGLANRLRIEGVDASIDAYDIHPSEGWPKWMEKQFKSDYIIVILSERYIREFNQEVDNASGARFEGAILSSILLRNGLSFKNIALVCFSECADIKVPNVLFGCTRYYIDKQGEYEKLYAFLTSQALLEKPELGRVIVFPRNLPPSFKIEDQTFEFYANLYGPIWKTTEGYFKILGLNLV